MCSGWGVFLASGPGRDAIIPIIRRAKEPEPIYGDRRFPGTPRRQVEHTQLSRRPGRRCGYCASPPARCSGRSGAASVELIGRLAWYLDLQQLDGQTARILGLGAAVAFGPVLLLLPAQYILQSRSLRLVRRGYHRARRHGVVGDPALDLAGHWTNCGTTPPPAGRRVTTGADGLQFARRPGPRRELSSRVTVRSKTATGVAFPVSSSARQPGRVAAPDG